MTLVKATFVEKKRKKLLISWNHFACYKWSCKMWKIL